MTEDIKYLEHKQVMHILEKIKSIRDRMMFSLMYSYGLRVSELLNVTLEDVDLQGGVIKIIPLKRKDKNKYKFRLTDTSKRLISEWLQVRPKTESPYLVVSRHIIGRRNEYDRMSRVTAYNLFRKYCIAAGNDKRFCHPHTLRHSFAVACASAGMDIYTTKELLRHSAISSTECYYRIASKDRDQRIGELHKTLGL